MVIGVLGSKPSVYSCVSRICFVSENINIALYTIHKHPSVLLYTTVYIPSLPLFTLLCAEADEVSF